MMQIPLALSKCDLDEERQTMMKDRRLRRVRLFRARKMSALVESEGSQRVLMERCWMVLIFSTFFGQIYSLDMPWVIRRILSIGIGIYYIIYIYIYYTFWNHVFPNIRFGICEFSYFARMRWSRGGPKKGIWLEKWSFLNHGNWGDIWNRETRTKLMTQQMGWRICGWNWGDSAMNFWVWHLRCIRLWLWSPEKTHVHVQGEAPQL